MRPKTVDEYLKEPYARVLVPETEGGFSAEILELPGCYAMGETADDALSNLVDAIAVWVDAAISQGKKIPEPFANYEGSGKVALRLPRSTHHKAVQMAEREDVSLNSFIVGAVEARVGAREIFDGLIQRLESRIVTKTAANVMAQFIPLIRAWDEEASLSVTRAATPGQVSIVNNTVLLGGR